MKLAKFSKSPAERKRYSIDYSDWLDTGETISSITFAVTPATTPELLIDAFQIGSPATSVALYVSGGTDGTTYTVDVLMTTSGGQIKEDQIVFSVRSA